MSAHVVAFPAINDAENARNHRKRKRRASGDGYIFRHGNFWFLRYRDWRVNGQGEREWKQLCHKLAEVEQGYRSKKPPADVCQMAVDFLAPIRASSDKPLSAQSLSDYIERDFLPYIQKQVRPSTFRGYESEWREVKPYCVDHQGEPLRLRDTETHHLQRLFERMAEGSRLSGNTLRHHKAFLSGVFATAIRDGILPKGWANPVREVKLPKSVKPKQETHAYSMDEINKMLLLLPEPVRTAVAVAAFTGLRRGEIRGLRWEDYSEITFDDGTKGLVLHIKRSVWNGIATLPKTNQSAGCVPVIASLAEILNMYRLRCGNPASGPIFANGTGKPACLDNLLTRQIMPTLERCICCGNTQGRFHAAQDHIFQRDNSRPQWRGWHGFRRGLATNLHRIGVPDKIIQRILRHANVAITQAAYIKTCDTDALAAMRHYEESVSPILRVQ
jgi:integrase